MPLGAARPRRAGGTRARARARERRRPPRRNQVRSCCLHVAACRMLACQKPQTPPSELLSPPIFPPLPHPPHSAEGSDYEVSEEEAAEDEDEENECDRCKTRQSEAWCTHPSTGKPACSRQRRLAGSSAAAALSCDCLRLASCIAAGSQSLAEPFCPSCACPTSLLQRRHCAPDASAWMTCQTPAVQVPPLAAQQGAAGRGRRPLQRRRRRQGRSGVGRAPTVARPAQRDLPRPRRQAGTRASACRLLLVAALLLTSNLVP